MLTTSKIFMSILEKPLQLIKKVFTKNGLIITLLIGSLVSLISFKIEDQVKRQRYLELLQIEIRMNYLTASDIARKLSNQGSINNFNVFSSDVFKAGLESGYILTIPQHLQSEMYAIYTVGIPEINNIIYHQTTLIEQVEYEWELCILDQALNPSLSCEKKKMLRDIAEHTYSQLRADVASHLERQLQNLSDDFNPAQERLDSPLLRLLMGGQILGIQK